jgi:TPR repeat protein
MIIIAAAAIVAISVLVAMLITRHREITATSPPVWPLAPKDDGSASNLTAMEQYQRGKTAFEARDYGEAMRWWRLAADNGVASAMLGIGGIYFQGAGVTQDYEEALRWQKMAAERGNTVAMGLIALHYAGGTGVAKDCGAARQWLDRAAAEGFQQANDFLRSGFNGLCQW